MTSQHPHQQSSQYYSHPQSQNSQLMPPPSRQSSPAVFLQHQHTSSASPYPTSGSQGLYSSDGLLAFSPPPAPNAYLPSSLQGIVSHSISGRSSAVARYASPAPTASPSAGYLAASTSGSSIIPSQAQPGVSSRIISSLQSLVGLLEKQNTKLDKHDERLKILSESLDLVRIETGRCNESLESFSKTMSKKLKTMTDTASKTLQEDIARSLEKDLAKLRKETSELGKISEKLGTDDSSTQLADIADAQTRLLQTLTTNQELASEQADSIVERISDAQLDLLHRLSDQFRLVTASINTSAASTRQLIEQSTSRPDQSLSQQIQQFLDLLQSIPARQSSVSTPGLPQITEETLAFPTPPASQLVPTSQAFPPTRSSTSLESTHRCEAPECTACLIQANPMTHEVEPKALQALGTNGTKNSAAQNDDEGFHTLSQMPASSQAQMANLPIPGTVGSLPGEKSQMPQVHRGAASGERRTITSPVQSACSHRRRPLGALQPFIMKKRKIIQSDDEEDHSHEDAEQESVDDAALACSSKMPQVNLAAAAAAHGQAFDRVQAWRTGVATTSLAAEADQPGFLSIQPLAASQKVDVAKQLATAAEMPPESPQTKKKSMRPVKGGGLATKTAEQTAIGKRRKLA